jgi:AcrR family transcriptional regulator
MGVKMVRMAQVRPYGGVQARERIAQRRHRLLDAGLELLGGADDAAELTVRAICRQAGVSARYFYESFTDKDELVAAVFDWVVADIAATTEAAVAAAPPDEVARAAMANIVGTIVVDARIGRLLFSSHLANTVLARKRVEAGALMAALSGQQVIASLGLRDNDRIKATAHFVVGGVVQAISAWLAHEVDLTPDELVDQLSAALDRLGDPELY